MQKHHAYLRTRTMYGMKVDFRREGLRAGKKTDYGVAISCQSKLVCPVLFYNTSLNSIITAFQQRLVPIEKEAAAAARKRKRTTCRMAGRTRSIVRS